MKSREMATNLTTPPAKAVRSDMAKAPVFLGIPVEVIKQWIGFALATIHTLNLNRRSH